MESSKAPQAIGPYCQGVMHNGLAFLSGMLPIDAESKEVVEGIEKQTEQILENLKHVLEDYGSSLDQVLKTTIYLKSMGDFQTVNGIYGEYFANAVPARSCIEVSRLPKDVLIEIELIAALDEN